MRLHSYSYYIGVILVAAIIIFLARTWFAPGSRVRDDDGRLPDHITRVVSTTLPEAVLQSRQRGKGGVRVTDPEGNIIWVSTIDPTRTEVVLFDAIPDESMSWDERITVLANKEIPALRRIYNERENEGAYTFAINITNHAEISALIYELSLRMFNIGSTSTWVIDMTPDPIPVQTSL
ncbi:hypothetical protein HYV72_01075 [Candidatus Uhrbacteria bacterium]|nr:hypothetical protein [Candidatus Uhrbacteria bacterium]